MTAEMTFTDGVADLDAAREEIASLKQALDSNRTIGIAVGLMMHRFQLTQEQAFRFLVRRSNETNTKLRDLAVQMVLEADQVHRELSHTNHLAGDGQAAEPMRLRAEHRDTA